MATVLLAVAVVGFQCLVNRYRYGEFRIVPSAAPPKIRFAHETFRLEGRESRVAAAVKRGTILGGGSIYATSVDSATIWLTHGRVTYVYAELGGG